MTSLSKSALSGAMGSGMPGAPANGAAVDMRTWVAIAAVPTMIAGIYGMNFDYMPELTASVRFGGGEFRYGYFLVVALMAAACATLYRAFKRSGWL